MIVTRSTCATDEYVEDHDPVADTAWCFGPSHPEPPHLLEPKKEAAARAASRQLNPLGYGIAYELGLYDDLPALLVQGEWVDTPTVEYRYGSGHPDHYADMPARWGHVAQGPRRYSVTSFIGATLGHLSRWTSVTHRPGPGTGFFSYNSTVGYWTLEPVPQATTTTSWADCASEADIDPKAWPLV